MTCCGRRCLRLLSVAIISVGSFVSTISNQSRGQVTANPSATAIDSGSPVLSFEDDVVPILEVRCFKCHGAEVRKAGLDLRRRFSLLKGGDSGAAIVPGKPDESLVIEMVVKKEMPPKEED